MLFTNAGQRSCLMQYHPLHLRVISILLEAIINKMVVHNFNIDNLVSEMSIDFVLIESESKELVREFCDKLIMSSISRQISVYFDSEKTWQAITEQ